MSVRFVNANINFGNRRQFVTVDWVIDFFLFFFSKENEKINFLIVHLETFIPFRRETPSDLLSYGSTNNVGLRYGLAVPISVQFSDFQLYRGQ